LTTGGSPLAGMAARHVPGHSRPGGGMHPRARGRATRRRAPSQDLATGRSGPPSASVPHLARVCPGCCAQRGLRHAPCMTDRGVGIGVHQRATADAAGSRTGRSSPFRTKKRRLRRSPPFQPSSQRLDPPSRAAAPILSSTSCRAVVASKPARGRASDAPRGGKPPPSRRRLLPRRGAGSAAPSAREATAGVRSRTPPVSTGLVNRGGHGWRARRVDERRRGSRRTKRPLRRAARRRACMRLLASAAPRGARRAAASRAAPHSLALAAARAATGAPRRRRADTRGLGSRRSPLLHSP